LKGGGEKKVRRRWRGANTNMTKAIRKNVMKAILCTKYGSPEVLQLGDVAKPIPKKNELCITIFATAITASDCIVRGFKLPVWHPMGLMMGIVLGFGKPRNPILGLVLSGEIESTGKDVKRFQKGDQVFAFTVNSATQMRFGAYAEYMCVPEGWKVALKPSNLTHAEAAAIPYGGMIALHFLKKANIQKDKKVLIYGASGAIGTSAVQLAKYYGSNVTGVCGTANLEVVKSLGADAVIDYTKDNYLENGTRYDIVFDAVGKRKSSALKVQCKQSLTPDGKYISVDDGSPTPTMENLTLLKDLAEANKIRPVIDRCYPLEKTAEAHRYVDTGHKKGNVIIIIKQ
jgi:NADPH:quinone reductase-like Zn-dependent oxidoreductase